MLQITVNGKPQTAEEFLSLADLVERAGFGRPIGKSLLEWMQASYRTQGGRRGYVELGTIQGGGGVLVENGMAFEVQRRR